MKGTQIIDVSLTPRNKSTGHITPVVGIEGGVMLDYDRVNDVLFWVQGVKDDEENDNNSGNVRILFDFIKKYLYTYIFLLLFEYRSAI